MATNYFDIFRRPLTVTRETYKQFDNELQGYIAGTTTQFQIKASVQPIPAEKAELMPEGFRTEDGKILYTDTELIPSEVSGYQPDRVEIKGKDYIVLRVSEWENNIINHYEVMVVEADVG